MASSVISEFLVSIGFAADDASAKRAEGRIKQVEDTARKSDQARTKTASEQAMARAAAALKAEGIERPSLARIMAKRDEMAAAEKKHDQRREEYDAKQIARQARIVSGLRTLVNTAAASAIAIQSVTTALAGYAIHVAGKLEEMAYASERTRSSVLDLKVFSQAVSQLGGSAGQALNDLEGFATRLRANPQGYTAFLKSVGVEARDAQGNIRGAAELYKEFRAQVGKKPYEQQLLYMQEMGVSEQTWRATDPDKLAAEEARSRAKYARLGYDPDKAAADAKGLEHTFRDMWESISIIGEKTASKIFADVGDNLRGFTTFIEQHGDQIADILSKVAQVVLAVSRALLELLTSDTVKAGLDWLLGMFGHVDEGTGKWVADTEKIKAALEALAIFVATVFVGKITGGIRDILKELKPLLALLAPFAAVLGLPILGTAAVGAALGGLGDPSKSVNGTGGRPDGQMNPGDELPGAGDGTPTSGEGAWARARRLGRAALGAIGLGGGGGAGAARIGRMAQSANVQAIIGELRSAGYNENAIAAVIGSMQTESSFNPRAANSQSGGHTGLWQWDRNRWPKIKAWIEGQGGNPYDAAWQTKAWVAEHNARPGDPIYDSRKTQQGGAILKNGPSLDDAITGVQMSERFGPGEEGGRAANARNWLPHVGKPPAPTPAPAPPPPTPGEAVRAASDRAAAVIDRLDKDKIREIGAAAQGFNPSEYLRSAPPVGSTSTSTDNSVRRQSYNRGDTTTNIYTSADAQETHRLWRRHEEREKADDLRHAESVFA